MSDHQSRLRREVAEVAFAVLLRQRFEVLSLTDALRAETGRAIDVLLGKPAVPTPAPVSIDMLGVSVEPLDVA